MGTELCCAELSQNSYIQNHKTSISNQCIIIIRTRERADILSLCCFTCHTAISSVLSLHFHPIFKSFQQKGKSLLAASSFKIHFYSEQILEFWDFNKQERGFYFLILLNQSGTKGTEQKSPFLLKPRQRECIEQNRQISRIELQ